MKIWSVSLLLLYGKFVFIYAFCDDISEDKVGILANNASYLSKSFIYNGTTDDCECDNNICVRKCCDYKYVFVNKTCVPVHSGVNFEIYDKSQPVEGNWNIHIISGHVNCKGGNSYQLIPSDDPDDEFYIQKNGMLWQLSEAEMIPLDSYCVDNIDGELSALVCFPTKSPQTTINIAGMIISMPFLLATFLIYALLPDLNIHGKSLMCYVLSLFLAYIFLSIINTVAISGDGCTAIALCCLFFFTTSIFWMNVMSIDIWRTFSGKRENLGNTKDLARKSFIIYNLYAWGVPFGLVMLVLLLNSFADSQAWYNPTIGRGVCWFEESIPELLYFYGPLALILVINLSLFSITALKIRKMKKDTAVLRSGQFKKHSEEDQLIKLYIRLSLAMGVNWIMEIVSWVVNWKFGSVPKGVWYLTDFCNAVYGVIIFFIFVFKKKIWKTLRARYPCGRIENCQNETNLTVVE